MNFIKKLAVLTALAATSITGAHSLAVFAADVCDANSDGVVSTQEAIQCGATQAAGGNQKPSDAASNVDTTIHRFLNLLSLVVGVVAVIMIIIGGFRYITSGGKQESVASAKNTILYAVVGLIIVAIAQLIVRFVLTNATTDSSNNPTNAATPGVSPGAANSPH